MEGNMPWDADRGRQLFESDGPEPVVPVVSLDDYRDLFAYTARLRAQLEKATTVIEEGAGEAGAVKAALNRVDPKSAGEPMLKRLAAVLGLKEGEF